MAANDLTFSYGTPLVVTMLYITVALGQMHALVIRPNSSIVALVYKFRDFFLGKISGIEWGSNPHNFV